MTETYDGNIWIVVVIVVLAVAGIALSLFVEPRFGRLPRGKRKIRIEHSPNYRNGMFVNIEPTPVTVRRRGFGSLMWRHLTASKPVDLRPDGAIETVATDLRNLNLDENQIIWLGHSSLLMILNRRTFLVDPALVDGAPLRFINRPFRYTNEYRPEDLPVIDCLMITHDHWDHLDYSTVMKLHDRIISIVCPLGLGEHFERWGFDEGQITELDWWQSTVLWENIRITCTPARHYSGRGSRRNQSLWASFVVESDAAVVFIGGDGGYGKHFKMIAQRFPSIDFAVIENGQYNEDWSYIHTLPRFLPCVVEDLNLRRVLTVHHDRFALARHSWTEPHENAKALRGQTDKCEIVTPQIGEPIYLCKSNNHNNEKR